MKVETIAVKMGDRQSIEDISYALSDVLCWLDGFRAGGGSYSPGSHEKLRELNIKLKAALNENPPRL